MLAFVFICFETSITFSETGTEKLWSGALGPSFPDQCKGGMATIDQILPQNEVDGVLIIKAKQEKSLSAIANFD